jgi:hypothetical protein
MGLGFPKRPLRSAFGPKLEDAYPVENPNTQRGASSFNGELWNTAGMGLVAARVGLIASWTGAAFSIVHQAEAWNPEGDQAHPVLARSALGRYSYTFAATYKDEDGVAVPTDIRAARASSGRVITDFVNQYVVAGAWIDPAFPLVVQVALYSPPGAIMVDVPFWLEVS